MLLKQTIRTLFRTNIRPHLRPFLGPLLVCSVIIFFSGSAAIAATPAQVYGIRPQTAGVGYFEYILAPGETVQDALVANNPSDAPLALAVWVAPGLTMAAGGITFAEGVSGPTQWVTLPDAGIVELPAQTSQALPFEVTVPTDTLPGEYVVGFLASRVEIPSDAPDSTDDPGGTGGFTVIVVSRVAVAMIITVPEADRCEAAITSLSSASRNGRWQLGIGLQNPGNVHFRGSGEFRAWPVGASEPLTPSVFAVGYFIPGDAIVYPLSLTPYPAAGDYNVKIDLRADCGAEATYTRLVSLDMVTVTVSAAPAAGGVVEGAGSYAREASVTVSATARIGYSFVNWTEDAAVVSTQATYPFTATVSRALTANFSTVFTPAAQIELVTTVGLRADACADTRTLTVLPGERVYYCYSITNSGNVTLTTHDLADDLLGVVLDHAAAPLPPGQSLSTVQLGRTLGADIAMTTTSLAVWMASSDEQSLSAAASAAATVNLGTAQLTLHATDGLLLPVGGADSVGSQVDYTVTVRNSGTAALRDVELAFRVPEETVFLAEAQPLPRVASTSAALRNWDCADRAPGGTVCTLRIAELLPGEEQSAVAFLEIVGPLGVEGLTVQFVATAGGTRLAAGPAAGVIVRMPLDVDDGDDDDGDFGLYLPLTTR